VNVLLLPLNPSPPLIPPPPSPFPRSRRATTPPPPPTQRCCCRQSPSFFPIDMERSCRSLTAFLHGRVTLPKEQKEKEAKGEREAKSWKVASFSSHSLGGGGGSGGAYIYMRIPLFFLGNLLRCLFCLLHQRIRSISLLAAARSESFRRSSYLLDTTLYRRVRERETLCNDATEIGFREFSFLFLWRCCCCVDCWNRFFCLLLVGRENWYEMQNSRWEMEKEEGEGVELSWDMHIEHKNVMCVQNCRREGTTRYAVGMQKREGKQYRLVVAIFFSTSCPRVVVVCF